MEKLPSQEKAPHFIFPSFEHEKGEIERVGKYFEFTQENFLEMFLERARETKLTEFTEEQWASLENTDSFDIKKGDWDTVAMNADSKEEPRDWQDVRKKLQNSTPLDAPVIAKIGNALHLVSGDTRLSVAKAAGIVPQVLIVDVTDLA